MDLLSRPLETFQGFQGNRPARRLITHGEVETGQEGTANGARGQADAQKSGTAVGSKMKSPPMGRYAMAR